MPRISIWTPRFPACPGTSPPISRNAWRTATFTAFRRLLDLCERESPDFLLLAGDVYNQEDASVSAQLALRDGFRRLESLSIPVFLVHGNHDPLASRLRSVRWPAT